MEVDLHHLETEYKQKRDINNLSNEEIRGSDSEKLSFGDISDVDIRNDQDPIMNNFVS
jgi:hypothetical protein